LFLIQVGAVVYPVLQLVYWGDKSWVRRKDLGDGVEGRQRREGGEI